MLVIEQAPHLAKLLHFIVSNYFAPLTSILIIYNSTWTQLDELQQSYLQETQSTLQHVSAEGKYSALQWLNVANYDESEFERQMLLSVGTSVVEGFITILPNTSQFVHARYFATRYAQYRLRDKFHLFLCVHENPEDLLALKILQFYPHHLMIRPMRSGGTSSANGTRKVDDTANKQQEHKRRQVTQTNNNNMVNMAAAPKPKRAATTAKTTTTTTERPTPYRDVSFEMWTQKFVGAVGNLDPVLLNAFLPNVTFANEIVELYPNKLLNLGGRALRLSTQTYVPYTICDYVPAGTGDTDPINSNWPNRSVVFTGSEAEIMKTFCKLHNCYLRVEGYGPDSWGIIREDGTSEGMMGAVYTQRVEVTIGCVYNWYPNITEVSHTLARSAITILGPAPSEFAAWRTSILPFDHVTWLMVVVTLFICSAALYVLKYSSFLLGTTKYRNKVHGFVHWNNLEKSLLDIFALFIQQSSTPTTFERFAPRIFLATLLCATITLENIYSGQLKSLLTVPLYTDPVDTVAKWAVVGWKWGAPSHVWAETIMDSDLEKEKILSRSFEVRGYDYLHNGSYRPDYGLGIERLHSGTFSFGTYINSPAVENRIILKDDLYVTWTYAVSILGWPLMPALNKHLRSCMESGLYVHWELQYVAKTLDKRTQEILINLASGHTNKPPPKALSIDNVSGPLYALCFGYLIATIAFAIELLLQRLTNILIQLNHT